MFTDCQTAANSRMPSMAIPAERRFCSCMATPALGSSGVCTPTRRFVRAFASSHLTGLGSACLTLAQAVLVSRRETDMTSLANDGTAAGRSSSEMHSESRHTRFHQLSDGRRLAFEDLGDPGGLPVFVFHGSPSCRLAPGLYPGEPIPSNVRLIAPDRPGFGQSDPQPGRTLADWPDDVAAFADALRLNRFYLAGGSTNTRLRDARPGCLTCPEVPEIKCLSRQVFGTAWSLGLSDRHGSGRGGAQAFEKSGNAEQAREHYRKVLASASHAVTNAFARPLARRQLGLAR